MNLCFDSPEALQRSKLIRYLANHVRRLWFLHRSKWKKMFTGEDDDWNGDGHYPRWDGGRDSRGKSYNAIWPKIASYCLDKGLNPEDLVRATFVNRTNCPYPNELLSIANLQRYHKILAEKYDRVSTGLQIQTTSAKNEFTLASVLYGLDKKNAWRKVLTSSSKEIGPLFRYVGAKMESLSDVAEEWFSAALLEYAFNQDAYDKVWKDMIPGELKTAAREFLAYSANGDQNDNQTAGGYFNGTSE